MDNKRDDIIFGVRAVLEAVSGGKEINKVLIQKDASGKLVEELKEELKQNQIVVQFVPVEKLHRLSKGGNHQGVVAMVSPVDYFTVEAVVQEALESQKEPLFIILDGLTDVRNFGAIARTAECLGVNGIIIPEKGGVSVTSDAVKTSAGALNRIKVARTKHIKDAVFFMQASGIQVVACTEKTSFEVSQADFKRPTAIIMGNEEKGISSGVIKTSDVLCKIPLRGNIASYNVSVAAGIILYEIDRQRNN